MEESVVGSVVGATIQVMLQNLLTICVQEINLIRSFKKDLEKLKNSFLMIQDFLYDAEKQQNTNKAVKRWLNKLESIAFDADNVLDELNYQVLRKKMETQNKIRKQVQALFSNRKMAKKIRDINERLHSINQEALGFDLQRHVGAHAPGVGSEALAYRETDSYSVDPIVLGRENDVSRIVEMLINSTSATHDKQLCFSVLPIVGMGGLGKTTLARQLFHDKRMKNHFEKQIWVYVSENFDPVVVFKKILDSLAIDNFQLENREGLLKKLKENLGGKRYLLVLDDVWNEEREKWDSFLNSLSGISSITGNGIILTTRKENVASIVKTVLPVYQLRSLSDHHCWSIIKATGFKGGDIPFQFKEIIAKRCQGLPLAANIIGGLLCDKSKDDWLSMEDSWLPKFGEDGDTISKILKLSFDHLALPLLKKCFAYCSIFPKGSCIKREVLIELWMAEGFLEADQRNDLERVGNRFFNLLLQNSLLQVVARDNYGNITYCNMHDLVHELASSILGSNSICRYIGLKSTGDEPSTIIPKEQTRYLRTLFFQGKVSESIFLDFKCVHVLVLGGQDTERLPSSIVELIHLRYLDISLTRIEYLPNSIGKLYHLQTLRTIAEYHHTGMKKYLRKLPDTLKYLVNLRHLHIPQDIELPPEIGRLTSLQTLPYYQVSHENGRRIGELGSLKNLNGKLKIHNLENVDDKEEAKSARLSEKSNIFELKFVWNPFRAEGKMINDENVLEGLQPHSNLKGLEICGYKGRRFPLWTLNMEVRDELHSRWVRLCNLIEIRIQNCAECEEVPMVGQLPHLKSIYFNGLTNVRTIGSSFYGGIDNSFTDNGGQTKVIAFPALERLELSGMSNLTEWVQGECLTFPRLEKLKIENCRHLRGSPSHFPCLKELEIYEMDSVLPLANICGNDLISLTKLKIKRLDGLISLPHMLFHNNQNLSFLSVLSCPNLTHLVPSMRGGGVSLRELLVSDCWNLSALPEDLHSLHSLEKLSISFCPHLKSIPYNNPSEGQSKTGFASLQTMRIRFCKELAILPSEMVESLAPSLDSLSLVGLTSFTNLPTVITCLKKMTRLTVLEIVDVPISLNLSQEIGPLCNLRELYIGVFSDSLNCTLASFHELLDAMSLELKALRILELYGREHWESLPDQLQHLTTLSYLALYSFGIEALPEWFQNLSSLETMYLKSCKRLKRLTDSKEAMKCLSKLTLLDIQNCPLLLVQSEDDDSEWPKISHIPRVEVDGLLIPTHLAQ